MASRKLFLRLGFDEPHLAWTEALRAIMQVLDQSGLNSDRFRLAPGHGLRSSRRSGRKIYSGSELMEEVGPGFEITAINGQKEHSFFVHPSHPRSPFQGLGASGDFDLSMEHLEALVSATSQGGSLVFGGVVDGACMAWQRCSDADRNERKYGPNPGFRVIEEGDDPSAHRSREFDISLNPGRFGSMQKVPAWVSADMWLGPAFWKCAPCTKEEVLKEAWLKAVDAPQYLYLKSYPEPFTRADGEQGRMQRHLWNQIFHQDCEWPPGTGGVV